MEANRIKVRNDARKMDIARQLRKGLGSQWHVSYTGVPESVQIERHRLPFWHWHQHEWGRPSFHAFLYPESMTITFPLKLDLTGPGVASLHGSLVASNYFRRILRNGKGIIPAIPWISRSESTVEREIGAKDMGSVHKLLADLSDDIEHRPESYNMYLI